MQCVVYGQDIPFGQAGVILGNFSIFGVLDRLDMFILKIHISTILCAKIVKF